MVQYVVRKTTLMKELDKAKCVLPSNAKGYIMQRDAGLPEKAWDTLEVWNKAEYELKDVQNGLRRLERPAPGRGGATHLIDASNTGEGNLGGSWEKVPASFLG